MSLKEVATSFAVGALLAGLAVGAYLWIDSMDEAHTIEPGSFTEVDGGVLIGAEADAVEGPVEVQMAWADPSDEASFRYYEDQIDAVDRVVELSTQEIPEGHEWREASAGSTFVVALPVPEAFDEDRLAGVAYEHGDYIYGHFQHGGATAEDSWTYLDGVYDPEERVFLVQVPSIGSEEAPVRFGVVEHAYKETEVVEGALDSTSGRLSEEEPSAEQPQAASFSLSGHAGAHDEGLSFQGVSTTDISLDCEMDDCDGDRVIEGHSLAARRNAVRTALLQASDVYDGLQGNQGPDLQFIFETDELEWNLHGPNEGSDDFSDERCAGGGMGGWYDPLWDSAQTCMNVGQVMKTDASIMDPLEYTRQSTAHELFHAYQNGYDSGPKDSLVTESTAMLAMDWEQPAALSEIWFPPQLTVPAEAEGTANEYRYEHLFAHFYDSHGFSFEQTGQLFQQGRNLDGADDFIRSATGLDGFGEAYWMFAKDLAYEDKGPEVRPPDADEGSCELFEGPEELPEIDVLTPPHPGDLDVDDRSVKIDPETYRVDLGDGSDTIETSLEPLTSHVYELDYNPTAAVDQALWVRTSLEPPLGSSGDLPYVRMKLYDAEEEGTQECWDFDGEASIGGSAGIEVWQGDEEATLLVSNLEHDAAAEYRLTFEAFAMWTEIGNNGQKTYWIETFDGSREVTTMSGTRAQFQQDEEPGSLKWSATSSGGISRPSYAFDQVYTVYGQGGYPDLASSVGPGSLDAPEGKVIARDAETGEVVWEATDDGAGLDIGMGAPGASKWNFGDLSGYQHEAIAGYGNIYVLGTHIDYFYPPGAERPNGPPTWSYMGVLAFDADDGSLAWDARPPDNPPHELNHVRQLALDDQTLYAKGMNAAYTQGGELDVTHKIWSVDPGSGDFQEVWSSPLTQSKMVMGDGQAIIAGWGSPATLTAVDLDTGEEAWTQTDVLDPPPQDEDGDRDVFTAAITDLAYEDGNVYVGTMIQDRENPRGAVYAFNQSERQWRYATDEMSPTPAVNDGTLYAMTGAFNVSDEEDPDSPEEAFNRSSILHAVDAARNETRWAVNASTTMTVTDERVYVGKDATPSDPSGASVAALDTATGEVVWVNEEDVQGPTAWTGAFVDGVLYVNTQANVVALHG